jgi:hypothetical protein
MIHRSEKMQGRVDVPVAKLVGRLGNHIVDLLDVEHSMRD